GRALRAPAPVVLRGVAVPHPRGPGRLDGLTDDVVAALLCEVAGLRTAHPDRGQTDVGALRQRRGSHGGPRVVGSLLLQRTGRSHGSAPGRERAGRLAGTGARRARAASASDATSHSD